MTSYPIPWHAGKFQDGAWWFIAFIGLALGVGGLLDVYLDPEPIALQLIEAGLVLVPAVAIIAGTLWVGKHHYDREIEWEIATWSIFGTTIAGVLVLVFLLVEWASGATVSD